ncbi:hypothetical protein ACFSO7_19935 [Bacillus sp. CGMCC 1.16607]|uniref:hypothetical protein n=1 Tax=Bacillus sp. CGMCC 1.16607 TaxID=3351842 RepID=UPI0036389B67
MKNEKGSTLLLVLVIIVVITTLGMALSSKAISTRLQFNKSDSLNVATDLAEMGITYLDKKINYITRTANQEAKNKTVVYMNDPANYNKTTDQILNEYSRLFCVELKKTELDLPSVNYKKTFDIETGRTIELTKLFEQINASECQINDEIPLEFFSKGTDGSDSKTIEITVYLTKNKGQGGGTPGGGGNNLPSPDPPPKGSYSLVIKDELDKNDFDNKEKIFNQSVYFEQTVSVQGNLDLVINGNAFFDKHVDIDGTSLLKINGNAYFDGELNFPKESLNLQGNSTLIINGIAIFKNPINFTGNSYQICITHPFLIVNNKVVKYDIPGNEACYKPLPPSSSQIDMDWSSEEKDIKVTY